MTTSEQRRFRVLVEPHLEALFRAAFRLTRNKVDAEDIVQDTCIRAFQQIASLSESQPVKAWLLRVLHNLFLDRARRTVNSPVASGYHELLENSASPAQNPEEHVTQLEHEQQLHHAWKKLDRGHQTLLALRAEGYSLPEITDITEIPMDALHSRLYRARVNLARHLKESQLTRNRMPLEAAK